MKKAFLALGIFIVIILVIAGYILLNNDDEQGIVRGNKLLEVYLVRYSCKSDIVIIYDNNTFEIVESAVDNGINNTILSGKYDYDIDYLLNELANYSGDADPEINYQVILANKEQYTIPYTEVGALSQLIESLELDEGEDVFGYDIYSCDENI